MKRPHPSPMVGALANGKAGLADFPKLRKKHIHARDGTSRHDKTAPPRRPTPARTIPPAGAKTGQTQHPDGPQFTNPSSTPTYRRVSAERRPAEQPVPPPAMKIAAAPSKAASFSAGRGKRPVSRREGGLFDGLDRMCRLREAHRGALRRPLRRVRRAALPRL